MQSHNASLTGGSEGVRYNASLSYYDRDGILLESNYKRVQGRMALPSKRRNWKSIWQPTIQALQRMVASFQKSYSKE